MQQLFVKSGNQIRAAFATIIVLCALSTPSAAGPITIASHEAHYDLYLKQLKSPGAATNAGGTLTIHVEKQCNGWIVLTRLDFGFDADSGVRTSIVSLSGGEESEDGNRLKFRSSFLLNGQVVDDTSGTARLNGDKGGSAKIQTDGQTETVTLPAGTMFPVASTKHSLAAAAAGKKVVSYLMFDGSGGEPFRAADVYAGKPSPLPDGITGDKELLSGKAHRVITTFYPSDESDAEAQATNIADGFDNGVIYTLSIDIGFLVAEGKLVSIHKIPEPVCD